VSLPEAQEGGVGEGDVPGEAERLGRPAGVGEKVRESGMSWGRPAAGSGCRDRLESGEKERGSTENVATNLCTCYLWAVGWRMERQDLLKGWASGTFTNDSCTTGEFMNIICSAFK
jgi:hypothetical protein